MATPSVFWKFIGKDGKEEVGQQDTSCYAAATIHEFSSNRTGIHTWISDLEVPSGREGVDRWLILMEEWGFPIKEFKVSGGIYNFYLDVDFYKNKIHLASTLTLLRYLWETHYSHVLKETLRLIDEANSGDSFSCLLKAHSISAIGYANFNHGLRRVGTKESIISKEEVFKRILETPWKVREKRPIEAQGPLIQCWSGTGGE